MLESLYIILILGLLLIVFVGIAFVFIIKDSSSTYVKNEIPKDFQFDTKVDEAILSDDTNNKAKIVISEMVQDEEEKHLPPEPVIIYQTYPIKYLVYDINTLRTYCTKELYRKIVFAQLWLDEPFHSTLFEILLFLGTDQIFVKDENYKPIISTLRDEYNMEQKITSYKVFSTLDITRYFFNMTFSTIIKKFTPKDSKYIILAYLVKLINQSYHFQTLESYDAIEVFLKTFHQKEQVKKVLALIENNDSRLEFFQEAYIKTLKSINSKPYVEKSNNILHLQLLAKSQTKILRHI